MGGWSWGRLRLVAALFVALTTPTLTACSLDEQGGCPGRCIDGGSDATLDVGESDVTVHPDHEMDTRAPCTTASCPKGEACNSATGLCGTSCAGGLTCNGGCCDGARCVPGTRDGQCGLTGTSCASCSGATPTCAAGTCTAMCDAAACGPGFCCGGSKGACMSGTAATACGSGSACVDCTTSANGHQCVSGACGCVTAADCPANEACNGGVCSTTCSTSSPCNGGCCNGTTCTPGTTHSECGAGGGMCQNCYSQNGTACLSGGTCGCTTQADCNADYACNGGACTTTCSSSSLCNGGCCSLGMCQAGTSAGACGQSGDTCLSCMGMMPLCSSAGACVQCNVASDCPVNKACEANTCGTACDSSHPCNQGCCDPGTSTCRTGGDDTACGDTGVMCKNCSTSPDDQQCIADPMGGSCGCNDSGHCAMYEACMAHVCGTSCGPGPAACNGGCCNAGVCAMGASASSCGSGGGACMDCTACPGNNGTACMSGSCGCSSSADCPGAACGSHTTCSVSGKCT